MNWTSRKRLASYLRSSLRIIPVVAGVIQQISAAIVFAIDARLGWVGLFRTPDWDDFVHLAFVEIRFYGASDVQIARRLRTGPRRLDLHRIAEMGRLTDHSPIK